MMNNPFLAQNRRNKNLTPEEAEMIASQLRKPSGDSAKNVTEAMSLSNKSLILKTYAQIAPQEGETILEVGPGNGGFFDVIFEDLGPNGKLTVLDHSQEILALLAINYQKELKNKNLSLCEGSIGALPFRDGVFSGICSINTLYFWQDPDLCLREIDRVLQPGGRLSLGLRSKKAVQKMPFTQYGFTLYDPAEVVSLLESNGFDIRILSRDWEGDVDCLCVTAFKPV